MGDLERVQGQQGKELGGDRMSQKEKGWGQDMMGRMEIQFLRLEVNYTGQGQGMESEVGWVAN